MSGGEGASAALPIRIAPSLLACDFSRIAEEVRRIEEGGADVELAKLRFKDQAGELIQLWAFAIANGMKMRAVSNMVAPYPTLGEVNKRAAGAYFTPKLFDNPTVKKVVGLVQRYIP